MTTKPRVRLFRTRAAGAAASAIRDDAASGARADDGATPPETPRPPTPGEAFQGQEAAPVAGSGAPSPAEEIAAIRQEGLNAKQLRMARRIAQRHGLAPTSDHDAVRILRRKGIDPFAPSGLLADIGADLLRTGPAPAAPANLPQLRPEQAAPPPAPLSDEAARLREVRRIQADIARRRRRKLGFLWLRLAVFVLLPTLLAGLYFGRFATPLYATHSEFIVQSASPGGSSGGAGGMMGGGMIGALQDAVSVQSYLESREAMQRLDAEHGFRAHFSSPEIDPLRRLAPDATDADVYRLYERSVRIGFDPMEGVLRMEVIAGDPATSATFAHALLSYAEERVEAMTRRIRDDQMSGARESYEEAELKVREAQDRVLELQIRLGVIDPASESSALMSQITSFERSLREKLLELSQLLDNPSPSPARVAGVRGDIERLSALVADLRSGLTVDDEAESLARMSAQLRIAEADLANRQALLQQALEQLETARIESNRQVRYLSVGVNPVMPDAPAYPRVAANTLLAFLIAAGIYLLVSMTISILREQVSS